MYVILLIKLAVATTIEEFPIRLFVYERQLSQQDKRRSSEQHIAQANLVKSSIYGMLNHTKVYVFRYK